MGRRSTGVTTGLRARARAARERPRTRAHARPIPTLRWRRRALRRPEHILPRKHARRPTRWGRARARARVRTFPRRGRTAVNGARASASFPDTRTHALERRGAALPRRRAHPPATLAVWRKESAGGRSGGPPPARCEPALCEEPPSCVVLVGGRRVRARSRVRLRLCACVALRTNTCACAAGAPSAPALPTPWAVRWRAGPGPRCQRQRSPICRTSRPSLRRARRRASPACP